jgi:hypothetical protein
MSRPLRLVLPWLAATLAACPEPTPSACGEFDQVFVYVDADGDGAGSTEPVGWVCELGAGEADNTADCDDTSESVRPGAEERCDGRDNDCDGALDEGLPFVPFYPDDDGDGFGVTTEAVLACESPGPTFVRTGGDCDDVLPTVNPTVIEVCNAGVDDDCDGLADDSDPGVDPTTQTRWFLDGDGDGWGTSERFEDFCVPPSGVPAVDRDGDCDDARPVVNPDGAETCNRRDDDCDGLVDDADPDVDPTSQQEYFADADADGFGDASTRVLACEAGAGLGVTNDLDCDDTDPAANELQDWFVDTDGDGAGDGPPVTTTCPNPGGGLVPERNGVDCEPLDPAIHPGQDEVCGDGIDQDCTGADRACATWLYTVETWSGTLERVDVDTFTWEPIGPLGVGFDFGDLAYDPVTGTMYMIDGRPTQSLYEVDLRTGTATLIGAHGVNDLFGLTVDTSTGALYAASFAGRAGSVGGFYELDRTTGAATFLGDPGVILDSLVYDESRDRVVGVEAGPGRFYELDRATGASTYLGGVAFVDNGGVAWDPIDDDYWYVDWSGRLYRYEPTALGTQIIEQTYLSSHAGLVYVPDPPN